ncbi:MAG: GNAT family N-acetyltransferase, partial [Chloroflexi bacterium]|nr:GNAT family N-acetyltransferase [Chloroflexota bacterium]
MKISPLTDPNCRGWQELLAVCFERETADMAQLLSFLQPGERLVSFGAWDGERLAAQYSCWLTAVHVPHIKRPQPVGMSVNMAVHPDYRGQGLVKQVAQPVYAALRERGAVAGVGFSNAAGVKVDRRSKGYGYEVVGRLRPSFFYVPRQLPALPPVTLTCDWPRAPFWPEPRSKQIRFAHCPHSLQHRFVGHPFRQYRYGVLWRDGRAAGIVVYRLARWGRLTAAALLAVYGDDLPQLLRGWLTVVRQSGVRWVHLLTTPEAIVKKMLCQTAVRLPQPFTRSPY